MTLTTLAILWMPSFVLANEPSQPSAYEAIPAAWLQRWNQPPSEDRPLQIVHGIPAQRATPEGMAQYRDLGMGGVVCNVDFRQYLQSDEHWQTLIAGIEACRELGMVVWLYDEEGYPSGAAGGLVLREDPRLEATVLVCDPSQSDPLRLRPAYEHTHASNNFHAARRYPNLIDPRATRSFLDKTHEAYLQRLGPHFGRTIQALFTDEPSLMAVNLGPLGEPVRRKVRVADPLDPEVRPLASVPWCEDLPGLYRQRYGEDLMTERLSLFRGSSPEDRQTRRQFWQLVAELVTERYFEPIGRWCQQHGVASSGHVLWEESPLHHVPLYGSALRALGTMHIPGLDALSSDPDAVRHSGWLTAALPASAAMLHGRRRVMTEVSDFVQTMGGQGPATLAAMEATAAWQAAWGVTDFTLYYRPADRSSDDYRAYGDFIGRLNAVLKPATPVSEVLLYYPVYDLWEEYLPVGEPLTLASQSPRAQRIVNSFMQWGQALQRRQIGFVLVDHELLAAADPRQGGALEIGQRLYKAVILPEGVVPPAPAAERLDRFRQAGGMVLAPDSGPGRTSLESQLEKLPAQHRLVPPADTVALGRFARDGRSILVLANVGRSRYDGHLQIETVGGWQAMDPATGRIAPVECQSQGQLPLALEPLQAILLVHSPRLP